jgi:hydroxyacylglutathione hydrolase
VKRFSRSIEQLMKLTSYTGGFVQTNGYLLESPGGNLLIDAPAGVAEWLEESGVRVDEVLLTHQHYDHVEGAAALQAAGARIHAFAAYSQDLTLESHARGWGLPISVVPYRVDALLAAPGSLQLCGFEFQLAHVPGHSTDSVTLYLPAHGMVFSGDTLFASGIGRTDLPHGSERQLLEGISTRLLTLPGETKVFPGHGPSTTIAAERPAFRH